MRKFLLLFLLFFFGSLSFYTQTKNILTEEYIDSTLEELRFNETISDAEKEKSLFNLKAESEKIGYKWGILKSERRIIDIYEGQKKNKEIIELATELKKIDAGPQSYRTMANIYRSKDSA